MSTLHYQIMEVGFIDPDAKANSVDYMEKLRTSC